MENPVIALLASRRSVKPDRLLEPGPKPQELETMLRIAARVPDHKKLAPWRFIVLEGDARARLGEVIAGACIAEEPERPSEVRLAMERGRLQRAPLVVAVVSRVTSGGIGYAVRASIAFSYLPAELADPGVACEVEVFGERVGATVVSAPLWDPSGDRIRA